MERDVGGTWRTAHRPRAESSRGTGGPRRLDPPYKTESGSVTMADPHRTGHAGDSPLTQLTPANVRNLELKWILPNQVFGAWQSTPLVVDGVMYLTQRPNDVLAVDAKTGRVFWLYRHTVSPDRLARYHPSRVAPPPISLEQTTNDPRYGMAIC